MRALVGKCLFLLIDSTALGGWIYSLIASAAAAYLLVDKFLSNARAAKELRDKNAKQKYQEISETADRAKEGWEEQYRICRATVSQRDETIRELEQEIKIRDTKLLIKDEEITRYERKTNEFSLQHDSLLGKLDLIKKQVEDIARTQRQD